MSVRIQELRKEKGYNHFESIKIIPCMLNTIIYNLFGFFLSLTIVVG
jgi:hypothetical protein